MSFRSIPITPFPAEVRYLDVAANAFKTGHVQVVGIIDDYGKQHFLTMEADAQGRLWPGRHEHVIAKMPA